MKEPGVTAPRRQADRLFLFALAVVGLLILAHLVLVEPPASLSTTDGVEPGIGGEIRDVDEQLIRRMIIEGRLSDREAEHYRKLRSQKKQHE